MVDNTKNSIVIHIHSVATFAMAMNYYLHTSPIHVLHISSFKPSMPVRTLTTKHHHHHVQRTRIRATLDDIQKNPLVVQDDNPNRVCLCSFPFHNLFFKIQLIAYIKILPFYFIFSS